MPSKKMYRPPVETSRHIQIQRLYEEYLLQFNKCMGHPSRISAQRARKALLQLKVAVGARAKEILELYAPTKNVGREPIN